MNFLPVPTYHRQAKYVKGIFPTLFHNQAQFDHQYTYLHTGCRRISPEIYDPNLFQEESTQTNKPETTKETVEKLRVLRQERLQELQRRTTLIEERKHDEINIEECLNEPLEILLEEEQEYLSTIIEYYQTQLTEKSNKVNPLNVHLIVGHIIAEYKRTPIPTLNSNLILIINATTDLFTSIFENETIENQKKKEMIHHILNAVYPTTSNTLRSYFEETMLEIHGRNERIYNEIIEEYVIDHCEDYAFVLMIPKFQQENFILKQQLVQKVRTYILENLDKQIYIKKR